MKLTESKLLSSIKGVTHIFSDKNQGRSVSEIASMLKLADVTLLNQVHGSNVVIVDDINKETAPQEGDALVTKLKARGIGVSTADCVPILIASNDAQLVASVHAGWRGTLEEIVFKTVSLIQDRYGVNPLDLKAAMGPSICGSCYEVGREVASAFDGKYKGSGEYLTEKGDGKYLLDLKTANMGFLEMAGVSDIDVMDVCTKCDMNYYSYRRDGRGTGRQLSVIGLEP